MKASKYMALAFENRLAPAAGLPVDMPQAELTSRLNIAVVFTSVQPTLAALKEAGLLAARLCGRITLLVPQVVPYPLPLTSPPVLIDWNVKRFSVIGAESTVDTSVRLYLCRDRMETLLEVLRPHSLIVVGGRKRWWPSDEKRLVRTLRRAGHEVIFKETE